MSEILWGAGNQGVRFLKTEYPGLGGWYGESIDQGYINCKEHFLKKTSVSEAEDQGQKQKIGDLGGCF